MTSCTIPRSPGYRIGRSGPDIPHSGGGGLSGRVVPPCLLIFALILPARRAAAQQIEFSPSAAASDSALAAAMSGVARQALALDQETDRDKSLDNRFRLELVAGRFPEGLQTLTALRELRRSTNPALSPAVNLQYDIYADARIRQERSRLAFEDAFRQSFRAIVNQLDAPTAAVQVRWIFGTSLRCLQGLWSAELERQQGKTSVAVADAIELVRRYLALEAYRSFQPLIAELETEDDGRRYIIDRDIPMRTPDGATICALVVRPRAGSARLPALLNFTIYADSEQNLYEARRSAAHGYVGVEGLTRGKGCSPDQAVPIEHDGADADALIDWITRQPWSDGRVGMYGGSYEGFTQWAATKHLPRGLKAIMPSVTFAPGVDFPMDGNVFMNYAYPWPFYTTNLKSLDNATYYDETRWARLSQEWYRGGQAYRTLDRIDGTPNPIFNRWLDHPSYDAYWQGAIPYQREFARIDIPVLTTTGYYDSGQIGALYYFIQHHKYNPAAEHYLLIGPYDHVGGQRGTIGPLGSRQNDLRGYTLDSVAQIDIGELRYQWFDYVLKGGPKPLMLQNRINYQVMGANRWKHAPSLAAMGQQVRFYLNAERSGAAYRLSRTRPGNHVAVTQDIDLADRSDAADTVAIDQALDNWNIVDRAPRIRHALEFVSDPFPAATEVSGLFSGRLDLVTNKRDFDFSVTLFELTPAGQYFQLSYHWARASYVQDRSRRRLLVPGRLQHLDFVSGRLTSRQFQAGSRLVVVIGILKQPGEQINYGTGKEVSDETIADAGTPLRIQWKSSSYVDIPVTDGT